MNLRELSAACAGRGPEAPGGRVASVAADTSLDPFPEGRVEDKRVVEFVADRLRTMSEIVRSRLGRLKEVDPVSQGLVCEMLEQIEKQLWMFESSRS